MEQKINSTKAQTVKKLKVQRIEGIWSGQQNDKKNIGWTFFAFDTAMNIQYKRYTKHGLYSTIKMFLRF